MFCKNFIFSDASAFYGIRVKANDLYSDAKGYGFVDFHHPKGLSKAEEQLMSGNWGQRSIAIDNWNQSATDTADGVDNTFSRYPLIFKAQVSEEGVYKINVKIYGGETGLEHMMIFTSRRNLICREISVAAGEIYEKSFFTYVCPYIPAMTSVPLNELAVYVCVAGDSVRISEIHIQKDNAPVLFIAGDSTLTDQGALLPYYPGDSCGGWAQMMPSFLHGIAVCNQAHSGLTTNCFRDDGHLEIVKDRIRPGDIFLLQFGHNDQKRRNLAAFGGYLHNIRWYVHQIRELGASPILVSPISRIPFIEQGRYQSMLEDHAAACRHAASELDVPLIDLHRLTFEYLCGLKEDAADYFCKGDITHTNDFGAYRFAAMVNCEIKNNRIQPLYEYLADKENIPDMWKLDLLLAPKEEERPRGVYKMKPAYLDLSGEEQKETIAKAMEKGLTDPCVMHLHPLDTMPRGQFLFLLFKALRISGKRPIEVVYCDISRYEWDAAYVQGAQDAGLIDQETVKNQRFRPDDPLTAGELASFLIRGMNEKNIRSGLSVDECYRTASSKGYVSTADAESKVTRFECYYALVKMMDAMDMSKKELPKDIEIHPVG